MLMLVKQVGLLLRTSHQYVRPSLIRHCHSQFKKACVISSGIQYKVYYEDHGPERSAGVVLCVHGDPGASNNFADLIQPLVNKDMRIIIPNFPGYGTTHSTERGDGKSDWLDRASRSQLLSDFIGTLGMNRIDVMLSHSAGAWSAISASAHNECVKSVCLMNPVGHRPHRTMRPYVFLKWVASLLASRFKILIEPLLVKVYASIGFSVSGDDKRDLMTSAVVAFTVDFKQVRKDISLLKSRNIPSVLVMTRKDKIIERQVPQELGPMIGIPRENYIEYDREGEVMKGDDEQDFLSQGVYKKGLSMARGGHFVHRTYPEKVTEEILQLIHHVKKGN